jgi:hypothetical protein
MSVGASILVIIGLSLVRLGAMLSKDQPFFSWPGAADILCIVSGLYLIKLAINQ